MKFCLLAFVLGTWVMTQAAPVVSSIVMVPRLTIQSDLAITNQIQCSTNLSKTNWTVLTNVLVTQSPYWFVDVDAPSAPSRFYRVLAVTQTNIPAPSNMVLIPVGTFTMGSPDDDYTRENMRGLDEVQHAVTLTKGLYMGRYLVTQGQYLAVVGSNPSRFQTNDSNGPISADLNRPVEMVSWSNATNYCARLTQSERAAGRLPSNWAYRLPTEAEWEYACRAGTTTAFHFGSGIHGGMASFDCYYEYEAVGGEIYVANPPVPWLPRTKTVGSYGANAFGLYDMHGNVWEWCQDWYGAYPDGAAVDPSGPASGSARVIRGGSWVNEGYHCRSAVRGKLSPTNGSEATGFRVVVAPY